MTDTVFRVKRRGARRPWATQIKTLSEAMSEAQRAERISGLPHEVHAMTADGARAWAGCSSERSIPADGVVRAVDQHGRVVRRVMGETDKAPAWEVVDVEPTADMVRVEVEDEAVAS